MATYYISASGNDAHDGLTPATAWQTVHDLPSRVPGGSTVRLRRGDTFFGGLRMPGGVSNDARTVITTYGDGAKPQICLYKTISDERVWEEIKPHVWRVDLLDTTCFSGNVFAANANAGFLITEGKICGEKMWTLDDLSIRRWWEFYNDERYLYVTCNRNPCFYGEIQVAVGDIGVTLGDFCTVEDLEICGGSYHGINGCVSDATVRRCDIHHIGGGQLCPERCQRVRFGNGVEFFNGGKRITVEDCTISDVYDVAFTMQGYVTPGWEDVVFRRNRLWNNMQSFEIWTSTDAPTGGMRRCRFEQNVCVGAGYCWSYEVRPDHINSAHLLLYATRAAEHDITVQDNVFYDCRREMFHKGDFADAPTEAFPADYVSRRNALFIRPDGYLCDMKYTFRATELARMQSEIGRELDSTITFLTDAPYDPKTVAYRYG